MTNRVLVGLLTVALVGCEDTTSFEIKNVSLRNVDEFRYPTVSGDEEGAMISRQANHFRVSEMRRNAETNWVATYVYQPAAGFVGSDYAEIEIQTGSDGASPPTHIGRVGFRFDVRD